MSKLEALLASIKELPSNKQRAVAALVGATVADAATCPLHWIYNQQDLDDILKTVENPEFFPESKCPFYTIPVGETSCYNDILKCALFYMEKNPGNIELDALANAFHETFGEGTSYEESYKARPVAYNAENRQSFKGPIPGPWLHVSLIQMLEYRKKGIPFNAKNEVYDGFLAALPLILRHVGSPSLWEEMEGVTPLLTTNENVQKFFHANLILLEACFADNSNDQISKMKGKLKELHPSVFQTIIELESKQEEPFIQTVNKNGKACSLPGSFLGSYLALVKTSSFVDAVRLNITAGGCNCSRANVIGAYFGAHSGMDAIPIEWMKRVNNIERVLESALNVARQ